MKSISKSIILFLGIWFLFSSCKKDKNDTLVVGATDYTIAEALFTDVFRIADAAMKTEPGVFRGLSSLPPVACEATTLSPALPDVSFPKTLTIDFGLINCTGPDGRKRRGKIISRISNKYGNTGTIATLSFNDFAINDFKINASVVITFNGPNYTLHIQNGRILTPENEAIVYASVSTREWAAGSGTQDPSDDVYLISGSSSGTGRQGINFSTSVKTPLRSVPVCRSIISGSTEIVINSKNNAIIDYGTGTCDDDAILTFENREFFLRLQ